MASRRQRRRGHEAAVHHGRQQRARLRAALDELPAVLGTVELRKLMKERGYQQDSRTGKWKRVPMAASEAVTRKGPSWAGITARRKRKRRTR